MLRETAISASRTSPAPTTATFSWVTTRQTASAAARARMTCLALAALTASKAALTTITCTAATAPTSCSAAPAMTFLWAAAGRDEMTGGTGSDNFLFYSISRQRRYRCHARRHRRLHQEPRRQAGVYSRVFRASISSARRVRRPGPGPVPPRRREHAGRAQCSIADMHGRDAYHCSPARDRPERRELRPDLALPKPAGAYPPANDAGLAR